jgi:hypothetical protein
MRHLLLADRLLRPGGWLLADDVANQDWPGVAAAWAQVPESYERRVGPPMWAWPASLPTVKTNSLVTT